MLPASPYGHHRYLNTLREHGTSLADTAEDGLYARVPSCPDRDMADLVWHVGEVHHFWRSIAAAETE